MKYTALIEKDTNKLLGWNIPKEWDITKGNTFVEVDSKVWQEALSINANYYENGKFIVKDFRNPEEIEEIRVNTINQKANEIIEAKYPIYKQLNIRGKLLKDEDTGEHYDDTDIEIMNMFIDTTRGIAKKAKNDGTPAEDVDFSNES